MERKTTSAKNTEWSGRSAMNHDLVGGKIPEILVNAIWLAFIKKN